MQSLGGFFSHESKELELHHSGQSQGMCCLRKWLCLLARCKANTGEPLELHLMWTYIQTLPYSIEVVQILDVLHLYLCMSLKYH